jgi:hypothetical protein
MNFLLLLLPLALTLFAGGARAPFTPKPGSESPRLPQPVPAGSTDLTLMVVVLRYGKPFPSGYYLFDKRGRQIADLGSLAVSLPISADERNRPAEQLQALQERTGEIVSALKPAATRSITLRLLADPEAEFEGDLHREPARIRAELVSQLISSGWNVLVKQ